MPPCAEPDQGVDERPGEDAQRVSVAFYGQGVSRDAPRTSEDRTVRSHAAHCEPSRSQPHLQDRARPLKPANFLEPPTPEVRRIPLLRTPVSRGKEKAEATTLRPFSLPLLVSQHRLCPFLALPLFASS